MIAAFFDKSAFAPVASLPRGIYGNVPKSAISGPAIAKTDIAVSRLFTIPGHQACGCSSAVSCSTRSTR